MPPDDKILFRIGLNSGEVVVQRDRIGGTTVNVTARLEALAELAAGHCRAVRDGGTEAAKEHP